MVFLSLARIIQPQAAKFCTNRTHRRRAELIGLMPKRLLSRFVSHDYIFVYCRCLPWSQRFFFAAKRRDKREKEAARENLW